MATPGDAFAAVILAALQAGGSGAISSHHGQVISPAGYVLLAAGPAALLGRRRFPATVLAVAAAAAVGFVALEPVRGLPYLALIAAFVNADLAGRRWAAITGLAASYAGILWLPGLTGTGSFPSAGAAFAVAAWHLTLLSGAEWYRGRRQRAQAVVHGREEEALRRATEERLRIARELHDVVAHSLAVIIHRPGQHGAAPDRPAAAAGPLHAHGDQRREQAGPGGTAVRARRPAAGGRGNCPARPRRASPG